MADSDDPVLSMDSIVQARGVGLLASELSETEAVMLDVDAGSYFGVESVAKTIWDEIAEPKAVSHVCAAVAEQYETADADVDTDTIDFLNQLVRAGLATVKQ